MNIRHAWVALGAFFLTSAAWSQTAPDAQVLGPMWQGQRVQVTGDVIAMNGACRQLAVSRQGIPGGGGRLWGCWREASHAPKMGEHVTVSGRVATTRMTRMGPYWRVVPEVDGL